MKPPVEETAVGFESPRGCFQILHVVSVLPGVAGLNCIVIASHLLT